MRHLNVLRYLLIWPIFGFIGGRARRHLAWRLSMSHLSTVLATLVAVFFLIQFVPVLAGHHLFLYFGARWGSVAWVGAYALTCLVLLALGALGTLSTMSERNGFRGPHELASGTRSVRPPRRHVRVDSIARRMLGRDRGVVRPVGVLNRVGPYKVRGAVRWRPTAGSSRRRTAASGARSGWC